MTTDILAQQAADLAVTKQQLRAEIESIIRREIEAEIVLDSWPKRDWPFLRAFPKRAAYRAARKIDALIPEDGASDGEGSGR
jgi:hypothetical protein